MRDLQTALLHFVAVSLAQANGWLRWFLRRSEMVLAFQGPVTHFAFSGFLCLVERRPAASGERTMKSQFVAFLALLGCASLSGCADGQERTRMVGVRATAPISASVGDTVLRVSQETNLPNINGGADVSGRAKSTGAETVQYLGVRDGRALFKRRAVNSETGGAAINSTARVVPPAAATTQNGSASVDGAPSSVLLADGTLLESVDLSRQPSQLAVADKTLTILWADNVRLVYVLSE